jgi:alkaline phosphatase
MSTVNETNKHVQALPHYTPRFAYRYKWTGLFMPLPGLHRIALVVNGSEVASVNWEGVAVSPRLAKNVILFIGDGMNNALITATRAVSRGFNKRNGEYNGKLYMQTMQKMGMVSTAGYDSIMPDSANTAASIASGSKGVVNSLGVFGDTDTSDPFDDARVELITELAQRKYGSDFGLGVVTTSEIQDATPSAFFAHSRFRAQKADITRQLFEGFEGGPSTPRNNELYSSPFTLTPEFDVILGGGSLYFDIPRTFNTTDALGNVLCCSTALDARKECPKTSTLLSTNCGLENAVFVPVSNGLSGQKNFYSDAQTKYGFTVVQNRSALMKQTQKAGKVLGMFHKTNMDVWVDRQKKPQNIVASNSPMAPSSFLEANARTAPLDQPDLAEMTDAAIKILSKRGKEGFFLMVEGASIDKQEHAFDHERVFGEMIDFDNSIGVALQYARANKDTLVLVSADHGHGFDVFGSVDAAVFDEIDKLSSDPSVKRLMQASQAVAQYDSAGFTSYVDTDGDNFPDNFDTARFRLAIGYADTADMKEDFMSKMTGRNPPIGHELPKAPSTLQVPGASNSGSGGVTGALPGTGIYAADGAKGGNSHGMSLNRNMPDSDADFLKAGIGAHPDPQATSKGFKLIDSTGGYGAHTLQDVPIYAEGPGANLIRTAMDQTDIFFVMANVLGLGGVPQTVSALG